MLAGLIGGAIYCAAIHETAVAIMLGTVSGMSVLAGVIIKGRDLFQGATAPTVAAEAPKATGSSTPRGAAEGKPKNAPTKGRSRTRQP